MSIPAAPPAGLTARALWLELHRLTGASLLGIQDTAGYFAGDTVEEALAELGEGISLTDIKALAGAELTIAAGAITATGSYHTIDTQADAASDDLDTINGLVDGQLYVFSSVDSGRNVVFKHGTGNIKNPQAVDVTLDVTTDKIFGFSDGTNLYVISAETASSVASGLGSYLSDSLVYATVDCANAAGGLTTALMSVQLKKLDNSTNVASARQVVVYSGGTQYQAGQPVPNVSLTLGTVTAGSIIATIQAGSVWLVETNTSGRFACTATDTDDGTLYFNALTASGGVSDVTKACQVIGSNSDAATWSA